MVHFTPVKPVSLEDLWSVRGFRLNIIGGVILMLVLAPLVYMAADITRPYEFHSESSFIVPPEAQGGDQITVMWSVTATRQCIGEVRRVLFDPVTKVEINYTAESAASAHSIRNGYLYKTFLLPKSIGSGWWGYRSDVCYACNPLQRALPSMRICYSTPSLYFRIT